jgi:hypothetical protein
MSYELRPLSLAEILDAAFRLVETEWRTLIGLSLVMQLPLVALGLIIPWIFDPFAQPFDSVDGVTTEMLIEMVLGIGGLAILYVFLYPFIAAAVTASVGNFYLGRRFEIGDAARAGLRTLFRLVASYFVWVLVYMGVMLIVVGIGALAFAVAGPAIGELLAAAGRSGTFIAVLLGLGVGSVALFWILYATVVSSLLPPIAVLESNGIIGTVRRAFALGATSKWRLIGIVLTTGMIVGIPVLGAQMLIGIIPFLGLLVWAVFQAVGFAFTTAVMVVLYFDFRCRAEYYDLELLAQQVEAGPGLGRG